MKFDLHNIGRHEALTLVLDLGFQLITGRGGRGKTTAARAMRAATGDRSARPELRDGADVGEVLLDGERRLKVTRTRLARRGEDEVLAVDLAFDGSMGPFEALVQPREVSSEGRFHAWVTALAELAGLQIGAEEAAALAAGDETIAETVLGLPPDKAADAARLAWHKIKGHREALAAAARASADADAVLEKRALAALKDPETGAEARYALLRGDSVSPWAWEGVEEEQAAEAEAESVAATRSAIRARAAAEQRAVAEQRRQQLEAQHGACPTTEPQALRLDAAKLAAGAATDAVAQSRAIVASLREQLARAEGVLATAEAAEQRATQDVGDAEAALEAARRVVAAWQAASIELAKKIDGPTTEDAVAAEQESLLAAAKKSWALCAVHARLARDKAATTAAGATKLEAAAKEAEKIALGTWERLGRLIGDRCPGVQIVGSPPRLEGHVGGVWLDWDTRMSPNQRSEIVLPLLAKLPAGRLVEVPTALWAELDPEHQRRLVAQIEAARVAAFAVWPTDDPEVGVYRVESGVGS